MLLISNQKNNLIIYKLAKQTDILIENFKVDGLKKYNLDYQSLSKLNSKIIYCSITGFGRDGHMQKPGYDFIIQALSGIMDLTGEKDKEPQKWVLLFQIFLRVCILLLPFNQL